MKPLRRDTSQRDANAEAAFTQIMVGASAAMTFSQAAESMAIASYGGGEPHAVARQFDPSRQATEQPHAEIILELPDLLADRGGRDAEFRRRRAEAPVTRRAFEGTKEIQRRQA